MSDSQNTSASTNMDLWNSVSTTDPKHTKSYKGAGGFSGTAISTLAPIMCATEAFGPLGKGWSYKIMDERFVEGGPIIDKSSGAVLAHEMTHMMRVRIDARYNESELHAEHIGTTPYITSNKYGVVTDHEAPKKTLSDALKKTLTMWGFNADVFLGMYDNSDYVAGITSDASDAEAETAELKQAEWQKSKPGLIKTIMNAKTKIDVKLAMTSAIRKSNRMNDTKFAAIAADKAGERVREIEAKKQESAR